MNTRNNLSTNYTSKGEKYFEWNRSELLPYIPVGIKKVLDVGCGAGNFGKLLKDTIGCEVYGVEPTAAAANIAKGNLNYVWNNLFDESIDFNGILFDCIFFNDVLEHLVDPLKALQYAKKLLTKDGHIVASIPNLRHFYVMWDLIINKDFKYVDSGILDSTHLKFFTKKSIKRLFNEVGLSIEIMEGINPNFGKKFKVLNFLTFNNIEDMKYIQFVVVASPNKYTKN